MPNNTTPKLRQCARRLLAYEAASAKIVGAEVSAARRVCEQLRGPLINLAGIDGYLSLLSRALTLAAAEIPWLRGLETTPNGSLEGLEELAVKLDTSVIAEGEQVLTTQLLGLLITLIGSAVTLPLLRSIWPTMRGLDL
jgi:nicotinic acid phosphoribosyltransferase